MKTSEERILRVLPFVAIAALASAAAMAMPTLPEIGFELTLRQAVTNSPQSKVTSSEMKSFSVDEKDGRTSLVWRSSGFHRMLFAVGIACASSYASFSVHKASAM